MLPYNKSLLYPRFKILQKRGITFLIWIDLVIYSLQKRSHKITYSNNKPRKKSISLSTSTVYKNTKRLKIPHKQA